MVHELKTVEPYYSLVEKDIKTFEIRKNDRDYKINDVLLLKQYSLLRGFSGKYLKRQVVYVLDNRQFCKKGYVVLGIKKIE